MGSVGLCRSKDVGVAAIFQMQLFAQLVNGHGKVANGDISLMDICQTLFYFTFVCR